MCSCFPFLYLVMKFVYIFCHCKQNTFGKNIRCATTQISAKLHILFHLTKRSLCLDASVDSEKNSFIRKNSFQIFFPIFQKCFCYRKDFVSFFYWYFTVVPFDTFFLVRAIFTFLTLINIFFTDISGFRFRMNWKNLNKTLKYCLIYIKYLFLCERNIVILQKTLLGFDYAAGESRKVTFFDTEVFKGFTL